MLLLSGKEYVAIKIHFQNDRWCEVAFYQLSCFSSPTNTTPCLLLLHHTTLLMVQDDECEGLDMVQCDKCLLSRELEYFCASKIVSFRSVALHILYKSE